MLDNSCVTLAVGTVLGLLSGIGVGGGSLLILWLTLALGMEHSEAKIINLLFFIPSALIASIFHRKQGRLNFKKVLPAIIAGCISAGAFSFISKNLDVSILKKMFGLLLLATGIRELLYKPKLSHQRRNAK